MGQARVAPAQGQQPTRTAAPSLYSHRTGLATEGFDQNCQPKCGGTDLVVLDRSGSSGQSRRIQMRQGCDGLHTIIEPNGIDPHEIANPRASASAWRTGA